MPLLKLLGNRNIEAPDPPKDVDVENNEGDHGQDASAEQSSPIDVIPNNGVSSKEKFH